MWSQFYLYWRLFVLTRNSVCPYWWFSLLLTLVCPYSHFCLPLLTPILAPTDPCFLLMMLVYPYWRLFAPTDTCCPGWWFYFYWRLFVPTRTFFIPNVTENSFSLAVWGGGENKIYNAKSFYNARYLYNASFFDDSMGGDRKTFL